MIANPPNAAPRRSAKGRTEPGSGALDRTISDLPVKHVYGPGDVAPERDLGLPGEYPYTRGIHANMYRDRLWTMRQFAGFGNARQTNERYKFLLAEGQTGLSVAFDMPTLMGYDSDAPQSRGEVGKCGVAIDSLRDMETLFDGIDMGAITTSMTINGPAAIARSLSTSLRRRTRARRGHGWAERCRPTSSKSTSHRRSGFSRPGHTCE